MHRLLLARRTLLSFGGTALIALLLVALAPGAGAAPKPPKDCVPTDGLSLDPTSTAPD